MSTIISPAAIRTYNADLAHSEAAFQVRHLLTKVRGTFQDFAGTIAFDAEQPERSSVQFTIQAASIDTNHEKRDNHLRSADFFDVEKYPEITFRSTEIIDAAEEGAKVKGVFSMHGVEKEVVLDLEIHGVIQDPWGNTRAGFTATTVIDRKEFGIIWNETLDNGNLLLGEKVNVTLEVEAIKA